ncbi:MAG: hypothetical protein ACP5RH_18340 [Leptodesmis sp.]|uniref:hypothetical protein n=1 Tax=Leptodesmis sp. TaxID=3100501 RepID=UPI003D0F9EFA
MPLQNITFAPHLAVGIETCQSPKEWTQRADIFIQNRLGKPVAKTYPFSTLNLLQQEKSPHIDDGSQLMFFFTKKLLSLQIDTAGVKIP